MKTLMRISLVLGHFFLIQGLCAAQNGALWNGRVFDGESQAEISALDMTDRLVRVDQIILAEKHLTPAVQNMQAQVISQVVRGAGAEGRFHVAWEFLSLIDAPKIQDAFERLAASSISALDFLKSIFGSDQYSSYAPILETTAQLHGQLHATNLTRAQKAPVVQGGIAAADPALVPAGFEMGSANYLERFAETMGGHATPEQIPNYFAAQCLTDDVIADAFTKLPALEPRFLVVGSFHADFGDGVVARIKKRYPAESPLTVKFIDAQDFSQSELESGFPSLLHDPKYGVLADFVVFVNEPHP